MILANDRVLRRLLFMSLSGTRGGPMRAAILSMLSKKTCNTNEIAKNMDVDYKTAQHHIRVLSDMGFVSSSGKKYADGYELSAILKSNSKLLKEVFSGFGKRIK